MSKLLQEIEQDRKNTKNIINKLVERKKVLEFEKGKSELYKRNLAIITGIRNAISHSNIEIELLGCKSFNDVILKFTDTVKDENKKEVKTEFQLSISVKDFVPKFIKGDNIIDYYEKSPQNKEYVKQISKGRI